MKNILLLLIFLIFGCTKSNDISLVGQWNGLDNKYSFTFHENGTGFYFTNYDEDKLSTKFLWETSKLDSNSTGDKRGHLEIVTKDSTFLTTYLHLLSDEQLVSGLESYDFDWLESYEGGNILSMNIYNSSDSELFNYEVRFFEKKY